MSGGREWRGLALFTFTSHATSVCLSSLPFLSFPISYRLCWLGARSLRHSPSPPSAHEMKDEWDEEWRG